MKPRNIVTWRDLLDILMDSPIYWTLTVQGRYSYLRWFEETYLPMEV